jgi:hypothetical protein
MPVGIAAVGITLVGITPAYQIFLVSAKIKTKISSQDSVTDKPNFSKLAIKSYLT